MITTQPSFTFPIHPLGLLSKEMLRSTQQQQGTAYRQPYKVVSNRMHDTPTFRKCVAMCCGLVDHFQTGHTISTPHREVNQMWSGLARPHYLKIEWQGVALSQDRMARGRSYLCSFICRIRLPSTTTLGRPLQTIVLSLSFVSNIGPPGFSTEDIICGAQV
jgi:hypothetical protein